MKNSFWNILKNGSKIHYSASIPTLLWGEISAAEENFTGFKFPESRSYRRTSDKSTKYFTMNGKNKKRAKMTLLRDQLTFDPARARASMCHARS